MNKEGTGKEIKGPVCDDVCHEHKEDFSLKRESIVLGVGSLLFFAALIFKFPPKVELILYIVGYILIGREIVYTAVSNIFSGKIFDENFLLTIATFGAFAIGKYPEAVAVMLFFKIGELLQNMAVDRSRRSISSLLAIRADYANLKVDGETKKVNPHYVSPGDIILIKPGERVPLDGVIIEGTSMVDTSSLTGESVPKKMKVGDEILSGMINKTGLLIVKVTKRFSESTVSKILELIENASSKKAPTEKFITKFAKYYTPTVVMGAIALATVPVFLYNIPSLTHYFAHQETFSEWIYKALIFLVISCPCALVISIPLGFFAGIGASARRGVLVKGSNYLEALNNLKTILWDKTGTLTKGVFKVTDTVTKNGFTEEEVISFAKMAEIHSNHPIAKSILEVPIGGVPDEREVEGYEEISGFGVRAKVKGVEVLVGNDKLLHRESIEHDTCNVEGTVVHVVIDKRYAGYLIISDEVKEDAKLAIKKLRELGIGRHFMVTGDSSAIAQRVAEELELDGYFAELLPLEKVKKVEEFIKSKENPKDLLAFVGDGINDAPVLMLSDIGIAMGAMGSDAAIEAADIVLMSDEPIRLPEGVLIAKKTRRIVMENIVFAMGVKGLFLIIGAMGIATMWEAVFADVGVALIAILNATRILKVRPIMRSKTQN